MKKPNILLLTSDQQHFSMLGAMNAKIKTPNLDALAADGMLFERAYCPNPTCTPSRSSILTGQYPSQHGAWSLGTKLPETVPTLSGALTDAGYVTALVGKAHFQPTLSTAEYPSLESRQKLWDLDFWKNFHDSFYGFSEVQLLRNHTAELWVGQHYALWMQEQGFTNWRDYFFKPTGNLDEYGMGTWAIPEEYHYNTWIAEKSCAVMEQAQREEKPFFLWASFPDPHYPQLVPAPWDKMYRPEDMFLPPFSFEEHEKNPPYFKEVFKEHPDFSEYLETGIGVHGLYRHIYDETELKQQLAYAYGMVSFMDKYIGKILDRLDELGQRENTLVIFTTDHGDLFGQHGLRHKCLFHYEDMLKIPLIARYPRHIPAGMRTDSLQSLVDLVPTILDYCGLPALASARGVDQRAVWDGKEKKARDWVVVEDRHEPHTLHMDSYVEDGCKITVHEGKSYGELYDLQNDPEEHNNLWAEPEAMPLKARLLTAFLRAERQMAQTPDLPIIYKKDGYRLFLTQTASVLQKENEVENLWNEPQLLPAKIAVLHAAMSDLMKNQPMPMPRICPS